MSDDLGGLVGVANQAATYRAISSKVFSDNAGTYYKPIFRVTGSVRVLKLYGVVTTVIGVNHSASYWRMNDGTNTPPISAAAAGAISAFQVGSLIMRNGVTATATATVRADQCRVTDPGGPSLPVCTEFVANQKSATSTDIEYSYATTDNPTSGAIQFIAEWQPISVDGNLVAV